jgi:phosphatidylinositol alpha-1,6-mannosyltransferase
LVVGEGDDCARLKSLARDVGVSERVRFLGAIGLQGLVEIYRGADLFVMPSTGEGFGIAFLEAMGSGTPALGGDMGGARDALADGELGTVASEAELPAVLARLLAAPKPDPHALAAAVRARFGRKIFVAGASVALNRLMEAN